VIKPFSTSEKREKDKNLSYSSNVKEKKINKPSKALIIGGFIISLTSIFLLFFTIKIKFG
tara:strand:+ start:858 stop:1037 length:180 start_codon:yes stop_codon:yes gene_type:complete